MKRSLNKKAVFISFVFFCNIFLHFCFSWTFKFLLYFYKIGSYHQKKNPIQLVNFNNTYISCNIVRRMGNLWSSTSWNSWSARSENGFRYQRQNSSTENEARNNSNAATLESHPSIFSILFGTDSSTQESDQDSWLFGLFFAFIYILLQMEFWWFVWEIYRQISSREFIVFIVTVGSWSVGRNSSEINSKMSGSVTKIIVKIGASGSTSRNTETYEIQSVLPIWLHRRMCSGSFVCRDRTSRKWRSLVFRFPFLRSILMSLHLFDLDSRRHRRINLRYIHWEWIIFMSNQWNSFWMWRNIRMTIWCIKATKIIILSSSFCLPKQRLVSSFYFFSFFFLVSTKNSNNSSGRVMWKCVSGTTNFSDYLCSINSMCWWNIRHETCKTKTTCKSTQSFFFCVLTTKNE